MDEMIGSMRERLAALERDREHVHGRLAQGDQFLSHLSNIAIRHGERIQRLETHRETAATAASEARRAVTWIEAAEARSKTKESAKDDAREARREALKLLYAALLVAAMVAYLFGLIDADKLKGLGSVPGPFR